MLKEQLELFEESIQQKQINLELKIEDPLHIYMNRYLAESMINNLIRNAILHNNDTKLISIIIEKNNFTITNSGEELTFSPDKIFDRFKRSVTDKKSLGIGLSVVKSICELYRFKLSYFSKNNLHTFIIKFK